MMKSKEEIRKFMLKKRKELSSDEVKIRSERIVESFLSNYYEDYETFLVYASFDNEVRTIELIEYLSKEGKTVFLPKVNNGEMSIGRFEKMETLVENEYGILEPGVADECSDFDVVVVPGVAFDEACYRLGFGKGFYDKFLKKVCYDRAVGFAFEFQVVDSLPVRKHDVKLDAVITEERIIGG